MNSKTTIANLALAYLGQSPIASISQDNEQARWLSLFYEPVRDEVLRTHDWAFALVQKPLVRVGEALPDGRLTYKYPDDCLFVRRVYAAASPLQPVPFEEYFDAQLHMRVILTPLAQAYVRYTRRIVDETQYDPAFVKCFALALASDAALALTGDVELAARLHQKYMLYVDQARLSNMMEGFATGTSIDGFSEVR